MVASAAFAVATALIALVTWAWCRRPRAEHGGGPPPPHPGDAADAPEGDVNVDPAEWADLAARLGAADATTAETRDRLVASRLERVIARQVPVRKIEPVTGLHSSRIHFADGTTVLGHGVAAGEMALLLSAVRRESVCAASCSRGDDGNHVRFAPVGRGALEVVVTGLDQPE